MKSRGSVGQCLGSPACFQAARFEDAIKKYTEALNACSDPAGKLALTIRNNR